MDAERLRAEYASLTGASKPGTRRLYELVVGFVIAFRARACRIMPPIYWSANSAGPRSLLLRRGCARLSIPIDGRACLNHYRQRLAWASRWLFFHKRAQRYAPHI